MSDERQKISLSKIMAHPANQHHMRAHVDKIVDDVTRAFAAPKSVFPDGYHRARARAEAMGQHIGRALRGDVLPPVKIIPFEELMGTRTLERDRSPAIDIEATVIEGTTTTYFADNEKLVTLLEAGTFPHVLDDAPADPLPAAMDAAITQAHAILTDAHDHGDTPTH